MKLIRPFAVTAANLTSNVAEDGTYPEYSVTATYALGAIVIETVGPSASHHAFESLVAGNIGNALTNAAKWLDLGATNRFAMFDQSNGSATTNATSIDASVAVTGRADGLALLNLDAQTVDVTMSALGSPRTNLLTYSEEFSQSIWQPFNANIFSNNAVSPTEVATADRVTPTGTAASQGVYYNASFGAGTFTFSVYAKQAGNPRLGLRVFDGFEYQMKATFDLSTASVVDIQNGNAAIQDVGDGWFRVSVTGTTVSGSMGSVLGPVIESLPAGVLCQGNFTADSVSGSHIWGAQLEMASSVSFYIATSNASVTTSTATIFSKRFNLQSDSGVSSWYDYFSEEIIFATDLVLTDLPLYTSPVIRAVINKTGTASCGNMIVGQGRELGDVVYGARVGIADYSRKTVDDFGNYTLVERSFAKRTSFKMVIPNTQIDQMQTLLAGYRATPVMWIGTDQYAATWVFGFYKDFSIEIAFVEKSNVTLEIEGLT